MGGEVDVISSPDSAVHWSINPLNTAPPPTYPSIMPRTRKQEFSAEEESKAEQVEQTEAATEDKPTSSEPNAENKEDDAAAKARERQARFKALQARAVSDFPSSWSAAHL